MKIKVEIDGLREAVRALERIAIALEYLCIPSGKSPDAKAKEEDTPMPKLSPSEIPVFTGKRWTKGVSAGYLYKLFRADGLSVNQIAEAIKAVKAKNWNKAASETFHKYLSKEDAAKVVEYCKIKGYIKS